MREDRVKIITCDGAFCGECFHLYKGYMECNLFRKKKLKIDEGKRALRCKTCIFVFGN